MKSFHEENVINNKASLQTGKLKTMLHIQIRDDHFNAINHLF